MNKERILELLRKTTDPDAAIREPAESNLNAIHKIIGFTPTLLEIVLDPELEIHIRQAAVIYLKNNVIKFWDASQLLTENGQPDPSQFYAAAHSIAPSCTSRPQRLALQHPKESSAIGRAACLLIVAASPRLSLPTSQLTASDLRVGPFPPTRNRTQQQSSKRASNKLPPPHRAAFTSRPPPRYARRRARPSLFIPTSWTVYLAHRHSALSVVLLTQSA